ncbi:MAG TPA: hypothetical protein VHH11_14745 [Gammaproteobacteria bacterium]|nr:hypothetical protein [Gammaproteobacteria bacterium]
MTTAATLGPEHLAFVRGGVSIIVAARDGQNETTVSRAVGCRVADDGRRITVFLSAAQSGVLLADVRANGVIAVVFSQPTSHRAMQLKGTDAVIAPIEAGDPHLLAEYRQRMAAEVAPLGYSEAFVRAFLQASPGDLVAVAFTPSAAFVQTPGPNAGARLEARS